MDPSSIDALQLAFSERSLTVLNGILGLIMFGVALDMKLSDFSALARAPLAPVVGLVCQFLLLPALTFVLAVNVAPTPSMALGMMLVAACPGGNVSNFFTSVAGGRVAVSVGMTAVSSLAAFVMTPLNLQLWGTRSDWTAPLVADFDLDPLKLGLQLMLLLVVPITIGMGVNHRLPTVAAKLRKPFKVGSLLFFVAFIAIAFAGNFDAFLVAIGTVFVPVALMNAMALLLGWSGARLVGLPSADRRAVAIEVGIQNSGLGLIIIFTFFGGLGGMAVVAAWWGIWHLVSGLCMAGAWRAWDRRAAR
ncbi:MAG: bile acid:sodium symporter family protein [Alphaproteobacteria bacterium]|nr:bile acid:sodium symporter family protein [Alphaproteobacteria bacterium]